MHNASLIDDAIAAAQLLVRELECLSDDADASQRFASELATCTAQMAGLRSAIAHQLTGA